jgi:hypothetical protein
MKKNLLVSFSGGETSAFMAQWLWKNKQDEYNMVFVFANTGYETKETIDFLINCSNHFGFDIHYLQPFVHHYNRKSTGYDEVLDIESLKMNGEPFEEVVKKYGLPNQKFKHCTRELKANPIRHFGDDWFRGEDYYMAIGIRQDEFDRMSVNKEKLKLIYPLVSSKYIPMTKKKVNFFWSQQPFRLELKGYEGNCVFCWKKSDKKLFTLVKDPRFKPQLDAIKQLEERYKNHYPRKENLSEKGELRMYRGNRTISDIEIQAQEFHEDIKNDHELDPEYACEVFSECGIDN